MAAVGRRWRCSNVHGPSGWWECMCGCVMCDVRGDARVRAGDGQTCTHRMAGK